MPRRLAAILAAALSSFALPAGAQVVDAPALGVRQHDGFFAQIQAGPAYLDLNIPDLDVATHGMGFGLNIAIGGSPSKNFVIFGEMIVQSVSSPKIEIEGTEYDSVDSAALSFTSIGPGVAYYFGESSFFLSGAIGLADATFETAEASAGADGIGFRLGAGKEWWVGDQWGIGLGANFFYASLSDEGSTDVRATSFALNLSATYH